MSALWTVIRLAWARQKQRGLVREWERWHMERNGLDASLAENEADQDAVQEEIARLEDDLRALQLDRRFPVAPRREAGR